MFSKLFVACCLVANIVHGQYLGSGGLLDSSHNFVLNVSIDQNISLALFLMQGPANVWFGVGWGSSTMAADTYAMILVNDTVEVEERSLGLYSGGSVLTSTIGVINDTTSGNVRTVFFYRAASVANSDYYNFSAIADGDEIDIIWAVGSAPVFGKHNTTNRGTTSMKYIYVFFLSSFHFCFFVLFVCFFFCFFCFFCFLPCLSCPHMVSNED